MSIDAIIEAVTVFKPSYCNSCGSTGKCSNGWDVCDTCHGATKDNPVVRLVLGSRRGSIAGQSHMTIVNPPTTNHEILQGMIGTEIWGNSKDIMVGDTATRTGYTELELVRKK